MEKIDWTGERFLPYIDLEVSGVEIHYEHLHRYGFALHYVRGKDVLDLASGEGYGSNILAREARKVVGVDIDPISVRHARNHYRKSNLEYILGSICEIPIAGKGLFDVITCFEAIEHIEDHEKLLSEIKRLLKDDGLLIISTPNIVSYTIEPGHNNPYHVKELNYYEFKQLIENYFSDAAFFGQKVTVGSRIWSLDSREGVNALDFSIKRDGGLFHITKNDNNFVYYIAVASNSDLGEFKKIHSFCIDIENTWISLKNEQIQLARGKYEALIKDYEALIKDYQTLVQSYAKNSQELTCIKNSIVWQCVVKYQKFESKAFPHTSRRGTIYRLIVKGLQCIITEGHRSAISKVKKYQRIRTEERRLFDDGEKWSYRLLRSKKRNESTYLQEIFNNFYSPSPSYVPSIDGNISLDKDDIKVIAFYLPQYHPIPENDQWWGRGFTEWTNVTKSLPQFIGHYQPHLPTDLGFYDLRLPDVQIEQVNLAKKYGIYGFCFHYYWFDGRKVLETPLNNFISNKQIDFPFCICWANENWTRRWDGLENEILLKQEYSKDSYLRFIQDLKDILMHKNYIKIGGKPIIIVYRALHIPNPQEMISIWRDFCKNEAIGEIFVVAAKTFGFNIDPRTIGFDGEVEFPPHGVPVCELSCDTSIKPFEGKIYSYKSIIESISLEKKSYPSFFSCFPGWDNTARRGTCAHIYHGSTPDLYEQWLKKIIEYTINYNDLDKKIVFINAWNEWAEGAHLEPDRKYGHAYLVATKRAVECAKKFVRSNQ